MTDLQKAIIATLKYHDQFDYPLTEKEIIKFLIIVSQYQASSIKYSDVEVKNSLNNLKTKKLIFFKRSFYYLPNRENIVEIRKEREIWSQKKLRIAKKTAKIFSLIPFVKAIAITGALAMNNATGEDDIDLMIITAENRLWLTRLIMLLILQIMGRRRKFNDKKVKDKICLNLYLDESVIRLSKNKQDIFTAHEIVQAKPILNKNNSWEKFLKENLWIKKFMPNSIMNQESRIKNQEYKILKKKKSSLFSTLYSLLLDLLNNLAFKLQYQFMKSKITNEEVSLHYAFFHPNKRERNS